MTDTFSSPIAEQGGHLPHSPQGKAIMPPFGAGEPLTVPLLVIISGPPCTGKTTLGRQIAERLSLPFVSKDAIKETLFDQLGARDRDWSRRLGAASLELLYLQVADLLRARKSLVAEGNFNPAFANEHFASALSDHGARCLQIQCHAEGQVLVERFQRRSVSGERHPGHHDHLNADEVKPVLLRGRLDPIDIGSKLILVDTTDFGCVDMAAILSAIKDAIEQPASQMED